MNLAHSRPQSDRVSSGNMSNQSEAASFNTTGRNASLLSSDMLRKLAYFSNEENHTSASSDGSPRNTAGTNDVSMIGGISSGGAAGGGADEDDDDEEEEAPGTDIVDGGCTTADGAVVVEVVVADAADDGSVGGCVGN